MSEVRCDTCLYNKNCQFFVKHKVVDISGCTAFRFSSDVVEVVRCKDCIHYRPYQKPVEDFDGWCTACRGETDENEFCSRGKRKAENNDA